MKEIVQNGAPILRQVATPLPEDLFGSVKLQEIIGQMEDALDPESEGVALAAPQIGIPYRLFIVRKDRTVPTAPPEDMPEGKTIAEVEVYINPEIVKTSRKRMNADEGCLSVRGVYGTTMRHERVTVRARRIDGSSFERGASALLAQIFEHEIDHLNGTLFIDHAQNLIDITREPHA